MFTPWIPKREAGGFGSGRQSRDLKAVDFLGTKENVFKRGAGGDHPNCGVGTSHKGVCLY